MSASEIITATAAALGGTSALGLAVAKVWTWWTTRDAEQRATRARRDETQATADATATAKLLAAYEAQASKAEERATASAEGRAAVAAAMASTAQSITALAASVDDHRAAVSALDTRTSDAHARLTAEVATLSAKVDEALTLLRGSSSAGLGISRGVQ